MKSVNVYFLRMASPSSVQPSAVFRRCSASARVSFGIHPLCPLYSCVSAFSFGFLCSYVIEAHAGGLDLVERLLLHLDRARPFRRARKRAAGDGPMVRALGALEMR